MSSLKNRDTHLKYRQKKMLRVHLQVRHSPFNEDHYRIKLSASVQLRFERSPARSRKKNKTPGIVGMKLDGTHISGRIICSQETTLFHPDRVKKHILYLRFYGFIPDIRVYFPFCISETASSMVSAMYSVCSRVRG